MKEIYIKKLILEKVRNLEYKEIPLSGEKRKHLIITGKNGSGKTTILDALAVTLDLLALTDNQPQIDTNLDFEEGIPDILTEWLKEMDQRRINRLVRYDKGLAHLTQKVEIECNDSLKAFSAAYKNGELITAYYKAERVFLAEIPKHVEKVELKDSYRTMESPRKNFVKYLLDLKVTQALAISNGKKDKAAQIEAWFTKLEALLKKIFENNQLTLEFDEESYKFYICEPQKERYDFNTLSSGYAAIMDIVGDLMLRMEKHTGRRFQYDLPGIVLIDEIETHLHLELQKNILELLTTVFPKIQFIVTTHSPFILNSLPDVVIYDLDQKTLVEHGLADVPYEGIVEGYFGANTMSDQLKKKFDQYKELTSKKNLTDDDFAEIVELEMYLDEIPDYLALGLTTEYQKMKLDFANREDLNG